MDSKILIVEDEFVMANALRLLLEQAGYSISGIAASAQEAIQCLAQQRPDIVLLDIRLEGKQSGIDLARKLKNQNIAFIYLSANSSQKVLEEAKKTEPYGFLVKPYREKDLLVALQIAAYRHQNTIESGRQQQEQLQDKLTEIYNTACTKAQKLLATANAIQPHIPFDLIIAYNPDVADAIGYLRAGYDEYQFIGQQELFTITGINANAFCLATKSDFNESLYTVNEAGASPFQAMLSKHFTINTYCAFTAENTPAVYFFCSRKHDMYSPKHIDLLNHIKVQLSQIFIENTGNKAHNKPINATYTLPVQPFAGIIGNHPLLMAALDLTAQVAPYNTSVLILGESGTGKEKIAEAIHDLSPRKNAPLIKVNCAAIPATLIESELFGYEKGAFTGAVEKRKGKFELADGGTIFLDEIGELPQDMQVRLLRVLQEKEIDPLGSSIPKKIDVRIVAATNRNLEKEVAEGKFRLDLYYRLNIFPVTLPPLRDRKSDIMLLALYFAEKLYTELHKGFPGISAAMADEMLAYSWPGNIRELENVIERAVILNNGSAELELKQHLLSQHTGTAAIENLNDVKDAQRETERKYLQSILAKTKGKIRGLQGAAALLNIKPTTLESKMAKLGIKKDDFKGIA